MTMNSDEFWERREREIKAKITMLIIDYFDVYDILHNEVLNASNIESAKTDLIEIIDSAIISFLSDN